MRGVVWNCVSVFGVAWHVYCAVLCDIAWYCVVLRVMLWYFLVLCVIGWNGVVSGDIQWYRLVLCGMVKGFRGILWC